MQDFYRCTGCGADTKQHINGRIRYMQLSENDKNFIKTMARKALNFSHLGTSLRREGLVNIKKIKIRTRSVIKSNEGTRTRLIMNEFN